MRACTCSAVRERVLCVQHLICFFRIISNHYFSLCWQFRRTNSQIYSLSVDEITDNLQAALFQNIPTVSALDVEYANQGNTHILMFAQEDEIVSPVYIWSDEKSSFILQQVY
jgi:hypothetical protein